MKKRLDQLLFERGLTQSRERAKTSIMAGLVYVNGQKADKCGTMTDENAQIELRENVLPYVSRGGLKLEKALKAFPVIPRGRVCLDCGASTGGFTDVLLQNGADKVYAVDVGYGQLAWKLRNDPRVVCLERTNVRYITRETIAEPISLAVSDLSFISLRLILTPVRELLVPGGDMICLIKPQFEAGREKVGKKGVVRDPKVHEEVIHAFLRYAPESGFRVLGLDFSPIRGPEGNIEYLAWLQNVDGPSEYTGFDVPALVAASHQSFSKEEQG